MVATLDIKIKNLKVTVLLEINIIQIAAGDIISIGFRKLGYVIPGY